MNVDRHYETFACFCSLTLFVSSFPINSFFLLPKVMLDAPHLRFQQLLRSSRLRAVLSRVSPRVLPRTLPQLNLHNTRVRRNPERLPSSRCIESAQSRRTRVRILPIRASDTALRLIDCITSSAPLDRVDLAKLIRPGLGRKEPSKVYYRL
jgi:hypothetical protein